MKRPSIFILLLILLGSISLQSCTQSTCKEASEPVIFNDKTELVDHAKTHTSSISFEDFKSLLDQNNNTLVIDIRTGDETDQGYIPGSILIPRGVLEFRVAKEEVWEYEELPVPAKDAAIVLYCRSGNRAALGAESLQSMGYTNVKYLESGWTVWHETYPEETEVLVEE